MVMSTSEPGSGDSTLAHANGFDSVAAPPARLAIELTKSAGILAAWKTRLEHLGVPGKPPKHQPFLDSEVNLAKQEAELDLLFKASHEALGEFRALLASLKSDLGGLGLDYVLPPLKARDGARAKLTRDRDRAPDPPAALTDIVRATLVCPTFAVMMEVCRALQKTGAVLTMKDRFSIGDEPPGDETRARTHGDDQARDATGEGGNSDDQAKGTAVAKPAIEFKGAQSSGYRDMNLLLKVPIEHPTEKTRTTFVISELQMNLPLLLRGKSLAHPVYEITRIAVPFRAWHGVHGAAFEKARAAIEDNPHAYTPYARAAARAYRWFVENHPMVEGLPTTNDRCACGLGCPPGEKVPGARVSMIPMTEIIDSHEKFDANVGFGATKKHLASQIEWITDIVRVRAGALDDTGAPRFSEWCSGESPLTLLRAEARHVQLAGVAGSAAGRLQARAIENRRAVDDALAAAVASGDATRAERAKRWSAGRPQEYTLGDLDFLNGVCAKFPRSHPVPGHAPPAGDDRAARIAALKAPAARAGVADFKRAEQRAFSIDDLPSRRSLAAHGSLAALDLDSGSRRRTEATTSFTRTLFDDFVLVYELELRKLEELMPKIYDIMLSAGNFTAGGADIETRASWK